MNTLQSFAAALAAALAVSCAVAEKPGSDGNGYATEAEIEDGLAALAARRVFFGHQSVGDNIVAGVAETAGTARATTPSIVETRRAGDIAGTGLYHAKIGENLDPTSKLRDFEGALRGGVGGSVDLACMKFCYVDIDERTDVAALFADYRAAMSRLSEEFPELRLLHCTAPLVAEEGGPKAAIKRLLGRETYGQAANAAREAYNGLIRAEYAGAGTLFDIALAEATGDGTGSARRADRYALRAAYTDDGGHLNEAGRRRVAGAFLAALGKALR